MASYEEDHNIRPQRQNQHRQEHNTLSQHLTDFFSLDHDPNRAARPQDFQELASAFQQLDNAPDSPLIQRLIQQLQTESENSTTDGVPQTYLDSLDRIEKKKLKSSDSCAICTATYLDDPYPLVVRLPCDTKHHFDLECIGPWLKLHSTCPLCRTDLLAKKEVPVLDDSEEEFDDTYG